MEFEGSLKARGTVGGRRKSSLSRLRDRRAGDEGGSVLILALVYIISISLIVGALADWAMNDLNNTTHFQSASSLDYAATSATQVAIQSIRYTPQYSVTKAPLLGPCWTLPSGTYISELNNFNGYSVSVWCSTVQVLASPQTRTVSFYACKSPTTDPTNTAQALADGETCFTQPLLYAQVAFDDYLPGGTTLQTTCAGPGYCGFGATELQWTWSGAAGSLGQAVNTITVTSAAPSGATVGGATYNATATASSGDSVIVTSGTTSICTVAGTVVSMVGVGTCTLDFNDNGNLQYAPAIQATQSFHVSASVGTTTTTLPAATTTTTVASSWSGSTGTNDIGSGNNYFLLNGTSGASSSPTGNAFNPGAATTLKTLTFNIASTSGSNHTATVDIISGGTATATGLSCTITGGSNKTQCSITLSVSLTASQSINIDATGNGNHTGSWTVTYTQP